MNSLLPGTKAMLRRYNAHQEPPGEMVEIIFVGPDGDWPTTFTFERNEFVPGVAGWRSTDQAADAALTLYDVSRTTPWTWLPSGIACVAQGTYIGPTQYEDEQTIPTTKGPDQ